MSEEKSYLIVNPKGAMHIVTEAHARERLKLAGWRLATAEEKAAFAASGGNQTHKKPLAKPWSNAPLETEALTEAEIKPAAKKAVKVQGVKAEANVSEQPN